MAGKRLNKRQVRAQQELEELERQRSTKNEGFKREGEMQEDRDDDKGTDESLAKDSQAKGGNLFATFADEDGAEGREEEEQEEQEEEGREEPDISMTTPKAKGKNKKKKKKKTNAADAGIPTHEVESDERAPVDVVADESTVKSSKKKAKKGSSAAATKSGKDSKCVSDMSMDEFSALLASQAQIDHHAAEQGGKDAAITATITPLGPLSSLRTHLSLSAPALDPSVELKRQFGAAAIKAYESEAGQGASQSSASAAARARSQAWNPNFKVRNILVQPKDTWPPIARTFTGMTMSVFDIPGRGRIGGWDHSQAYKRVQLAFLQAVQSYEPNHLMNLLRQYPWHIDTLLQLSDISRHQGDLGQASDFNARALFAFERTSAPIFTSSLVSHLGPPMLNFDRIEDRGFWLAAHRNVNFLGRRGTWRTALEWVKLILGLDPAIDHHGMLLWLDFLSIKSRQHSWFLDFLDRLESAVALDMEQNSVPILHARTPFDNEEGQTKRDYKGALDWYVGLSYAKALALRAREKERGLERSVADSKEDQRAESTTALRLAIARHPQLIPPLLEKIGASLPKEVPAAHPLLSLDSEGDTLPQILTHIYVARSESLWREPGVSSWLTNTLKDAWPTLQASFDASSWHRAVATSDDLRRSIYRHVLVSDLPDALRQTLIGLMPKEITQDSAMLNAFDPLPPQGQDATSYDNSYFSSLYQHREGYGDGMGIVDLDEQQSAGMLNRLFQALQRIRGGAGGEGEDAGLEMNDELRQQYEQELMQLAMQAEEQGLIPGAMPGEGVEGDAEEGDDETDRQDEGETPIHGSRGGLRAILDRMWGATRQEDSSDTRGQDERESEEE